MATAPRTPSPKSERDHLPPQVRAQVERGEQLQRELMGQPEPTPAPANGNGADHHAQPPQSPQPPQPPQPPTPPQQPAPQPPAEEDWQQRFEREHGRLKKAREDMPPMSERMTQLEQLLVTHQALGPAQPQAP